MEREKKIHPTGLSAKLALSPKLRKKRERT
jgi:hypothetical protein